MKIKKGYKNMTLKEWLKKIDLVIDVKIWGQDDEIPLFEGSAFDIPWTIIVLQLRPFIFALIKMSEM